jgi:hypothetical protein
MPKIFVLNVPEFAAIIAVAADKPTWRVTPTDKGYTIIESDDEMLFSRRDMKCRPANWYGLLSGGFEGSIVEFGRDILRVVDADGMVA